MTGSPFDSAVIAQIDSGLDDLRAAADSEDLDAAADAAAGLREILDALESSS